MPTHVGPCLEPMSDGVVGPASVVGLGVPEVSCDGSGRLAVGTRQFQGIMELRDGSQVGDHRDLVKLVLTLYYHGFIHGFYPHQTGADIRADAGVPDAENAVAKKPLGVSRRNLGVKKMHVKYT